MPCEGESLTTTSGSSLMFLLEQELKPSGMWWRSIRRWCCGLQAWRTISVKARAVRWMPWRLVSPSSDWSGSKRACLVEMENDEW